MRASIRPHRARRRFDRRARVALAAVIAFLYMSAGAYAYFSAAGGGSGVASVGSLTQVTIDDVVVGAALRPGGPARDVTIKLKNPNAYAVDIVNIAGGDITSDRPGCQGAAAGITLALGSVSGTIPSNTTRTYTASASMSTASVSACQGATLSTTLVLQVSR